jgi:hypothetical protein
MNQYQEDLFVAKTQELLVHLGMLNNDAQWPALDLYAAMCTYLELERMELVDVPGTAL